MPTSNIYIYLYRLASKWILNKYIPILFVSDY